MTNTGYNTIKAVSSQNKRFRLELLENRTLLNADLYGIADVFYSDAAFDNLDELEAAHEDHETTVSTASESSYISSMDAVSTGYTLYLNFDEARVYSRAGDFWLNQGYVDVPGYDLSMYGWSGYEAQSIEYITQFVQEDYAAYNVNVTTTEPENIPYTTIYVGGTSDWFQSNSNIIGVASYDIGNRDSSNYGFAFTEELSVYKSYAGNSLLNFSEYVANLISHEAGHTFGTNHVSDSSYLMNPTLSTANRTIGFGNGLIPSSSSTQDSQILLGVNLGYANGTNDDFGDNISTASTISPTVGSISGILEHVTDTDAFTFEAATSGTFSVDLSTTVFGNLDSTLTIYDAYHNTVAYNDDYFGNDDSLVTFQVEAGEEYTIVVGSSGQNTSGTYTLALSAPEGKPEIQVTDTSSLNDDLTIDFGQIYIGEDQTYSLKITNSGSKTLSISNISTSGIFDYEIPNNKSSDISIPAGESTTISVTYNPEYAGSESGQIIISSNDEDNSFIVVNVSGSALENDPDILVTETDTNDSIDLGIAGIETEGSRNIIISNDGRDTLEISSITTTEGFSVNIDHLNLEPGESQQLAIYFSSDQAETLYGELTIVSNDPDESVITYDLTGQVLSNELSNSNSPITINEADGIEDGIINGGNYLAGDDHVIDLWYVTNNSTSVITIDLSQTISSVFTTEPVITIPAGETATISTVFNTTMPYSYSNDVYLAINNLGVSLPLTVNADSYAEFGNRSRFTFSDHDGDTVTLVLRNGTGKITLGNADEPDIKNLEINDINRAGLLTIRTSRGGSTTLGDLSSDGDIRVINAPTTDIDGTVDIDGEVTLLKFNNINDSADIQFDANSRGSSLVLNSSHGDINVDGMLRTVKARTELGGSINVDGDLRTVVANEKISADIAVNGNITVIKTQTLENSDIDASGYIKSIGSTYIEGSAVHAKADIYSVAVRQDMVDSAVTAGYSPEFGQAEDDTTIRSVYIRNQFIGSTISSGITPNDQENIINGSAGNFSGTIGAVRIGNVITLNSDEAFGIIANGDIRIIKIGREKITESMSENDFNVIEIL